MPGIAPHPEPNLSPEAQVHSGLLASNGRLRRLLDAGIDLLFPPRCAGCGRVDERWCVTCQTNLEQVPISVSTKLLDKIAVASSGVHAGILREAVQGLKYENTRLLGQPLGARLSACLTILGWPIDIVVPTPLHPTRLKERGYNQAQLLAEYASANLMLPCRPAAIRRERYTQSQVGLGAQQRLLNVIDAFQADPLVVARQTILVVDDVCTTGATLTACAAAALAAGADAVYGLTVTTAS
jgi:competence protein ComFC